MDPKEEARRIFEALNRERKSLGWGRSKRLDRKLERGEGYVVRLLSGKRGMRVEQMFEVIDGLGFEPGEFFAWVYGAECRVRPERYLASLERKAQTTPLLRRVDRLLATTFAQPSKPRDGGEAKTESALLADARRLDELRFSYPLRAREEALPLMESIVDEVEKNGDAVILCDGLALLGSIEGVLNNFPSSAAYFRRAIVLAQKRYLPGKEASLLRRCSALAGNQGDYDIAIAFTRDAESLYSITHNLEGMGKTFVGRGIIYREKGDDERAILHFKGSLLYLSHNCWQWRVAAYQGLSIAALHRGEIAEAEVHMDRACREHKTREGLNWHKLIWLRGEIAFAHEKTDEAEALFLRIREVLAAQGNAYDIALISLKLSKVYFLSGRFREVQRLASDMVQLLEPLREDNKIANCIVVDFIKEALAGKVTEDFLDSAYQRLQQIAKRKGSLLQ